MNKFILLIASHNSRIQCLIDRLKPNTNKTRFQNCAIMRLSLTENSVDLELVYSGELSEKEKTKLSKSKLYYTTPDKMGQEGLIKYENWTRSSKYVVDMLNLTEEQLKDKTYIFYIIRHGQGKHNKQINLKVAKVSSTLGLEPDTHVTNVGENQAYNSGLELKKILKMREETINYWFASDLVRTRQTIVELTRGLDLKPSEIVILPCSSEINTSGSGKGDCDLLTASSFSVSKFALENYPKCTIDDTENKKDVKGCNNIEGIPVNWNFYLTFYGGQMRSQNDTVLNYMTMNRKNVNKQQCRNTNMISMAIFYINSGNYLNDVQGRRYIWYKQPIIKYITERKHIGGKLTKKRNRRTKSNRIKN